MDAQLFGSVNEAAALLVGTWDPLVPTYRKLLQELIHHARENGQAALAVLLDPAPQSYMKGAANWPVYMAVDARVHRLLAEGLDGVLCVDFKYEDLRLGVYDVLGLVRAHVPLAEVWMRSDQTFGRSARGSVIALAMFAKKHGLTWKRLPRIDTKQIQGRVQQHLERGEVAAAETIVGLPCVWNRPDSGELRLAWKPGTYEAVPLQYLDAAADTTPIVVELVSNGDGLSHTAWPDRRAEYLAFVKGPGDRVPVEDLSGLLTPIAACT